MLSDRLSHNVEKLVKNLKEDYKLTNFEALTIALKAEHDQILKLGFVISSDDSYPSALEKIAEEIHNKK